MFLIRHPSQIASTTLCVHYVSGITELCLFHQTVCFHSHFETLPDKTLFFFLNVWPSWSSSFYAISGKECCSSPSVSDSVNEPWWKSVVGWKGQGSQQQHVWSTAAHYMCFCCGYPEEGARPVSMIVCYPQFYWATVTAALHPDCTILKLFQAWITDREEHQAWWSSADKSSQKWKDTKDHILTDCIIRVYR